MKNNEKPWSKYRDYRNNYYKNHYKQVIARFRNGDEEDDKIFNFIKCYGNKAFMKDAYYLMQEHAKRELEYDR